MRIHFLPNGNTLCFDSDERLIPEFNRPWLKWYLHWLRNQGVDLKDLILIMPDGKRGVWDAENDTWWILGE